VWLGHSASLHSHATLHPHFCSPGLCFAKPLFGLQKRRKQPERYAPFFENFINILTIYEKCNMLKFIGGKYEKTNDIILLFNNRK
jgi:hypothetical protein